MAPVTYYYFFSVFSAIAPLLWLINLVYLKKKGRTIIGQVYPIGTPDYKRITKKVANSRILAINLVIVILTLVNLAWSIVTVLEVNTLSARSLLVIAPVIALGAFIVMIIKVRREYGDRSEKETHTKASRKQKGKDDSWLS